MPFCQNPLKNTLLKNFREINCSLVVIYIAIPVEATESIPCEAIDSPFVTIVRRLMIISCPCVNTSGANALIATSAIIRPMTRKIGILFCRGVLLSRRLNA